ncbi:MAG: ABC transporter ATP-binding protein/permease, partial [Treponema sp.]|nr:ABC transporter ATP-binding protein/permease [Treponema sp.]
DEITRSFNDVMIFLSVTSAAMLLIAIYNAWFNNIFIRREDQAITFALNRELFEKATSVDISCYENPEFYDKYTRATMEVFTRAQSVLQNCSVFAGSLFASIFVIYTVTDINLVAGIFMFLTFIGSFVFGRINNKFYYQRDLESTPYSRRMNYVNRVMYLPQYAKEMRLSGIFSVMQNIYGEAIGGMFKTIDKFWKRITITGSFYGLLCFSVVFQGTWLYAAYLAMVQKSILLGDFIVLSSAIVSVTWMLFGVRDGIVEGAKNAIYIENLKSFLAYKPKIDENQKGISVTTVNILEFRNVCFRYTQEGNDVLRDICMTVKAGEKIALVGHNGAGKTTLVKLIMRLYDPTEGQILLNGIDIKQYDLQEYRNMIGVVFQDFQIFSLSAAENVIMKKLSTNEERERALEALKQSGAYEIINTLVNKEETILTREFDDEGVILSGGEYQKIATARAFAKDARLLIMDEPSSALDPIAEHMMYETIMRLCARKENVDKLAIIISHRLSSAAGADHVYMLEQGQIIEHGHHRTLLGLGGAYADMYIKQAKSYLSQELELMNET